MTSTLDAIKDQIVTDVETTSIVKCYDGYVANTRSYPYAQIFANSASYDLSMTQVFDRDIRLDIYVTGTSATGVEDCIQELQDMWTGTSQFAALQLLGVVTMMLAGSTTQSE